MRRIHRLTLLAFPAAALMTLAAVQRDWSALPPEPAEVEQALTAARVDLAAATEAAGRFAGGMPLSARAVAADGRVVYEVVVAVGVRQQRVQVDGATGEVSAPPMPAWLSLAEIAQRATTAVAGSVGSIVLAPDAPTPMAIVTVFLEHRAHVLEIALEGGKVLSSRVQGRFPGLETSEAPFETGSGLMWIDLEEGHGAMPASPRSVVTVHYTGYLLDGTKFDSSVDRGQPASFPLNGVIPGWTEGVGSMRIGGKRKLIIPHELAYGPRGRPPTIPPAAMLVFDVELLAIQD
jgi:hypothetical protein